VSQTAGPENCVTVTGRRRPRTTGWTSGWVTETYDVVVTQSPSTATTPRPGSGSSPGPARTTWPSVAPSAGAPDADRHPRPDRDVRRPTPLGGLLGVGRGDDVTPDDLIAGQRWHVTVDGAFAEPTATSGGDYDGRNDTTYIVRSPAAACSTADVQPQIKVTTTNGIDLSGPTTVTGAGTDFDIGTKGSDPVQPAPASARGPVLRQRDRDAEGPMRTSSWATTSTRHRRPGPRST
jgi:hypothetical protein